MSLYCGQIADIQLKVKELKQDEKEKPDVRKSRKNLQTAEVRLDNVSYEGASLSG